MSPLQDEVFPYPQIGNEELEEIKQLVAPVERFFSEEGDGADEGTQPLLHVTITFNNESFFFMISSGFSQNRPRKQDSSRDHERSEGAWPVWNHGSGGIW